MSTFTRRHWGREALAVVRYPFRVLEGPSGKLSGLRMTLAVVLALVWLVLTRGEHFTMPDVYVLAVVVFALPLSDLFAMVPVREALAALVAVFGGAAAKRTRTTTYEETEIEPAPRVPSEEPELP